ncbi:YeeE/YedE family protein [Neolewinella antarctica]|uniref:YeeE/YedE family protein n=1 Tax=Neolewinella antarctica TaxID=442734 RepID=A0ABX0XAX6_9BACT|nr:YeeE/YedE thiosulfate transporter family protein [Neolewinella antarctica]NJC26362.1 hypothetical protein [Neolewinella antarctica]
MYDLIAGPWHWAVSGFLIAQVMFALLYAGKSFGVSANLRTMCTIAGAEKYSDFFRIDWREQRWNLLFIAGAVIGGFIAYHLVPNPEPVQISEATITHLRSIGIESPAATSTGGFVPDSLFAPENFLTLRNLIALVLGGFLIGFGTRWAGGCTSGHAISGLSNLQLPSLIAVIGFFIGGLLMSWVLLPIIVQL